MRVGSLSFVPCTSWGLSLDHARDTSEEQGTKDKGQMGLLEDWQQRWWFEMLARRAAHLDELGNVGFDVGRAPADGAARFAETKGSGQLTVERPLPDRARGDLQALTNLADGE